MGLEHFFPPNLEWTRKLVGLFLWQKKKYTRRQTTKQPKWIIKWRLCDSMHASQRKEERERGREGGRENEQLNQNDAMARALKFVLFLFLNLNLFWPSVVRDTVNHIHLLEHIHLKWLHTKHAHFNHAKSFKTN